MEANILKNFRYSNLTYSFFYYLIVAVLLFSGVSKIIDPAPMIETMKAAFKVNENLVLLAATLLPIIEIALGLMLVLKIKTKKILLAITVLLFGFFLFSVYGLVPILLGGTVISLSTDCGCFGGVVKSEFGITMIIRNLVLLTVVFWLAIKYKKIA